MNSENSYATKPQKKPLGTVWLALAFRPFFLLAPLMSLVSLIVWSLVLNGQLTLYFYGGALWWHMHEMLFGFSSAVIAGFLLTAVKNWTGLPGFGGWKLGTLVFLWLLARFSLPFANYFPNSLIIAIDMGFLPLTALTLMLPIVKAKRWQNLIFLPILIVMIFANGLMHYAAVSYKAALAQQASYLMVMMIVLLVSVMAGRIFPMFTANGTQTQRVNNKPWLEKTTIAFTMLATVVVSFNQALPVFLSSLILTTACLSHVYRALRWRPQVTIRTPLVWSLHVSYWCIPIGLALFALEPWFAFITRPQALHSLTVGGIGLVILAMISRVSLGHTGRKLSVGKWMSGAFISIILALVVRVFGTYFWQNYTQVMSISILFWVIGYGLFIVHYWSVLTKPRVDGQPG